MPTGPFMSFGSAYECSSAPLFEYTRMVLFFESATYAFPAASVAMPSGRRVRGRERDGDLLHAEHVQPGDARDVGVRYATQRSPSELTARSVGESVEL